MAAYEQHSVMGTTCSLDPAIQRYDKTVTATVMKYSIRGHLHATCDQANGALVFGLV